MSLHGFICLFQGQLKMAGTSDANGDPAGCRGKVGDVEKLRLEVENLRRSLITAFSESNGILRLEEQFTLLKVQFWHWSGFAARRAHARAP